MILVTGATGLNGKELVRQLSARGVALRALVRSVAKAAELSALPNVEIVVGDMAHAQTLSGALRGVDRAMLISSSEPAMLEIQSNFIAAAASAKTPTVRLLGPRGLIARTRAIMWTSS